MLAKRIIPCLDVRNGRVVKGKKFSNIKDVDDPVVLAKRYSLEGADELVLYDITASNEGRNIFTNVIEEVAKQIRIPFMVGGGIRAIDDFARVLERGADKVSVNTAAVKEPQFIKEAALKYGSQCVVLSMDVKKVEGQWKVFINGGRENTGLDAVEWAKKGVDLGAGEIVINSIDTDGVKKGFNIDITNQISRAVNVPIIASGGAGCKEHFLEVFEEANADGGLAASIFHYNELEIKELKNYLNYNHIPVRRDF